MRYSARPCDNEGTLDPPPPRDRTWDVHDRQADSCVAGFDTREEARVYARGLNGAEHSSRGLKSALLDCYRHEKPTYRWRHVSDGEEALRRGLIEPMAEPRSGHKLTPAGRFAAFELERRKAEGKD